MHEFALSLSQVEVELLIAVAKGLTFVLGQPLVGVHDFETHLMYRCALVINLVAIRGISINLFIKYCAQFQSDLSNQVN